MTRDDALIMEMPVRTGQAFDVLLMPVSRPELGEIRIGEDLFAIGRGEAPFVAYPAETVSVLSRRHARIFAEDGAVYVADLGSKNGTRVNGDAVAKQPALLRDGDEVSFGAALSIACASIRGPRRRSRRAWRSRWRRSARKSACSRWSSRASRSWSARPMTRSRAIATTIRIRSITSRAAMRTCS